jgi:Ca-activated chloride channel homolog
MTINIRVDRKLIRAGSQSRRYVLITFAAPEAPSAAARKPVNVSLVMDRSGSMSGRKLELVREAVRKALSMLRQEDRFALVVYDHEVEVLAESAVATREAKQGAMRRLEEIDARGNTNLAGGWLRGCEQIAAHQAGDVPGRCLLLTDGLANEGITDRDELARHAAELHARGISTSTFGVGADFDEMLLQGMAVAGGGHSYFVETPVQIPDLLTSELGEALDTAAHDAAIEIGLPRGVRASCLNEFVTSRTQTGLRVSLGSLASRQEVSAVLALEFPTGDPGAEVEVTFGLTDRGGALESGVVRESWTWADHASNDMQPRDRVVDRAVAELYAAQARSEAVGCNRRGDFDMARHVLQATAERILGYAGDDQLLQRLARELLDDRATFSLQMTAMHQKARYYASQNVMRMRDQAGKAKRRPQV